MGRLGVDRPLAIALGAMLTETGEEPLNLAWTDVAPVRRPAPFQDPLDSFGYEADMLGRVALGLQRGAKVGHVLPERLGGRQATWIE